MIGSFAVGLGAFCIFAISLAFILRVVRTSPFLVFVVVSLIIHAVSVLLGVSLIPGWNYWYCAALYWFAVLVDLFLMGAYSKSVTLMMLQCIYRHPQKTMVSEDLYQRYVLGKFEERVHLLVTAGNVAQEQGSFKITERGQRTARFWRGLQSLFGIEKSGLYFTKGPR